MYSFSKKAFTLVEIMVVIGVIGVLATVMYPSMQSYLRRASDTETQRMAQDFILLVTDYISQNGGFPSSPSKIANPYEGYCVEDSTYCSQGSTNYHTGLTVYIKNNPEGLLYLQKRDKYCTRYVAWGWNCSNWTGLVYKESDASIYSEWNYIIPGRSTTDSKKNLSIYWYLDYSAGYYDYVNGTDVWITGSNIPIEANKRCSPGFASYVYYDPSWIGPQKGYTECMYIIEL